jgi:hypothetical protein
MPRSDSRNILGVMLKTSYETQQVYLACCKSAMPLPNIPMMRPHMVLKFGEERVGLQRGMTALSPEIVLGVMVKTSYESQKVKPA